MTQTIPNRPAVDTLGGLAFATPEPGSFISDRAEQVPVSAGMPLPPLGYVIRRAYGRVTQAHIDRGVPGSEIDCPVALAIVDLAEQAGLVFEQPVRVGPGAAGRLTFGPDIIEFIRKVDA